MHGFVQNPDGVVRPLFLEITVPSTSVLSGFRVVVGWNLNDQTIALARELRNRGELVSSFTDDLDEASVRITLQFNGNRLERFPSDFSDVLRITAQGTISRDTLNLNLIGFRNTLNRDSIFFDVGRSRLTTDTNNIRCGKILRLVLPILDCLLEPSNVPDF